MPDFSQIAYRIKREVGKLYSNLKGADFDFTYPNEAFAPPDIRTEEYLSYFALNGCPLPRAIAEFYRQIGSVNFCGSLPTWNDVDYPDPLNVMPLQVSFEWFRDEYVASPEQQKMYVKTYGGFYFRVSPDLYHKQGVSGGDAYGFALLTTEEDPVLMHMQWKLRFIEYVDFAILRGGFPGISPKETA